MAKADEVDIGFAVDLDAAQKEDVDAALPGAVEELAAAIGEGVVAAAVEDRHLHALRALLLRQQRRRGRDRRCGADRDMAHALDPAGENGGQQLLRTIAECRSLVHSAAAARPRTSRAR